MDQQEAPIYYGRSVNKVYNQEFIIDSRFKIVKELGHGAYGIVCSAKYDNGSKRFLIQTTVMPHLQLMHRLWQSKDH